MPTGKYKRKPCLKLTKVKIGKANSGTKNGMYKHGMTKTRFYRIWRIMKNRCVDKSKPRYKNISVCKSWQLFDNFKNDMYISYLKHVKDFGEFNTTIDRINNNKNYYLDNCRWATKKEQSNNRNVTLKFKYNNRLYTIRDLCYITGVPYATMRERLTKLNWSVKKALSKKFTDYEYKHQK